MLLTIDIGNSSTKFGIFKNNQLAKKFALDTSRKITAAAIFECVGESLPDKLDAIIISTVVKEVVASYGEFGRKYFNTKPIFIDHTFDFGFSIKYFPQEDCGTDRLVDAYAAVQTYGTPCIICDFGTATTIDFVNRQNEYVGGIITPGPDTLGGALFEKTSKLPKVNFEKPGSVLGNSTVSSIQSGIYFGYVGLVDGLIERIIDEEQEQPQIISTGGFANLIAMESRYVEIVEEELMLDGLHLIYKNWESKK